jgi:hypothetical protein
MKNIIKFSFFFAIVSSSAVYNAMDQQNTAGTDEQGRQIVANSTNDLSAARALWNARQTTHQANQANEQGRQNLANPTNDLSAARALWNTRQTTHQAQQTQQATATRWYCAIQ